MSAASCSLLGRLWKVKGPGLVIIIPVIQQMVARRPAHARARRAAAGRDLARQRLGAGQCGGVLPRHRSGEGDHPGRALRRKQPASSRRPRCARCSASTISTRCWRSATSSTPTSGASSTSRPTPGASRSRSSSSSTSISTRPWSGRSPGRRKPSASAAPRSSTPRANSRRRRSSLRPARFSRPEPEAMQLRYLHGAAEHRRRAHLDHRAPDADQSAADVAGLMIAASRMSRKSGSRFSDKDMRHSKGLRWPHGTRGSTTSSSSTSFSKSLIRISTRSCQRPATGTRRSSTRQMPPPSLTPCAPHRLDAGRRIGEHERDLFRGERVQAPSSSLTDVLRTAALGLDVDLRHAALAMEMQEDPLARERARAAAA